MFAPHQLEENSGDANVESRMTLGMAHQRLRFPVRLLSRLSHINQIYQVDNS
jgi:hypothetical protein